VRISATGGVAADVAWRRYERLALWPTWAPQITRAEPAGATLTTGLRGRVYGPLGVHADFVVDEVGDREWRWTVTRGPLTVHLRHGVEPHGTGSRTWLEAAAPVLVPYAPLAWWAIRRLVTRP
jgi:hypothetical protein